jgi:hypothetical protein
MKQKNKDLVIRILWIAFYPVGFVLARVWDTFFGWWVGPWLQRRSNEALWSDVQANLYFLCAKGRRMKETWPKNLPFNQGTVTLEFENLRFNISRGRDQLQVYVGPTFQRNNHELEYVVATLEGKNIAHFPPRKNLAEVADLVRPRLDDLKRVFSESEYPKFRNEL